MIMKTATKQMPGFVGKVFHGIFEFNRAIASFFNEDTESFEMSEVVSKVVARIKEITYRPDATPFTPLIAVVDIGYYNTVKVVVGKEGVAEYGEFLLEFKNGKPTLEVDHTTYSNHLLFKLELSKPAIQKVRRTFSEEEKAQYKEVASIVTLNKRGEKPLVYTIHKAAHVFKVIVSEDLGIVSNGLTALRTVASFTKEIKPDYVVK